MARIAFPGKLREIADGYPQKAKPPSIVNLRNAPIFKLLTLIIHLCSDRARLRELPGTHRKSSAHLFGADRTHQEQLERALQALLHR